MPGPDGLVRPKPADREVNDPYTHVMVAAHLEAAERVARLVREAGA